MIPVAANTFASEQGRETLALRNHVLGDECLVLILGLSDDELANLFTSSVRLSMAYDERRRT